MNTVPLRPGLFIVDGDGARALKGTRCAHCGRTYFPPRRVCPRCRRGDALADVALGRIGVVHAATHVVRHPAHFACGYVLAEVDLPEGVRLRAQLGGDDAAHLRPGDRVELAIEPLFMTAEGQAVLGYRFHKKKEAP